MDMLALLIQKARTWKKLSNTERWLLLQALILLPIVTLLLKGGLKRTHSLLSRFLPSELSSLHPASQIRTTVNMVKVAAKYLTWATCLKKALVLWFLLRRQGIDAELKIGTRLEQEFQAHAWVEYEGFVLGEHQGVKQHYIAFDKLDTKLAKNLSNPSASVQTSTSLISSLRREDRLLLYCVRSHIDAATASRIENLLQNEIDWNYLLQQACQQEVFLLFYQNLIKNYSSHIPKNIQPQLQAYCQIKTARNLFLSKKLCQILELFNAHDIKVIPFKGSVLAADVYKNLALREFCDIDLIIEETDFPKAKELLFSQGYQVRDELQQWGQDFTSEDDKIHIDIHWQLAPSCYPYRADFQELLQRCQTVSILNQKVITLSPEDLLLILCVQVVKDAHDRKEKLKQICDIAELIRTSSISWQVVIQQAISLGSERLLLFGLAISQQLTEIEIPLEIRQKIGSDRILSLYLNHIIQHLFSEDYKQQKVFSLFSKGIIAGLYGFLLRGLMLLEPSRLLGQRNRQLIRHLFSSIINPNSRDLEFVLLPKYLNFLYYLVRPIRLGLKFYKPSIKINSSLPDISV